VTIKTGTARIHLKGTQPQVSTCER